MSPQAFSHQIEVPAPVGLCWEKLQEPESWKGVAGVEEVSNPVYRPDGSLERYDFVARAGPGSYSGTAQTVEYLRPTLMVVSVDSGEIAGSVRTGLEAISDERTAITVSVEVRPKGMMAQLFFPLVAQAVRNGLPAQVEGFAARLQSTS